MKHPLLIYYGPIPGWLILIIIGSVAVSFFLYHIIKATRLVLLGAPDDRFDSWGLRFKELLVGWLGQKKVLRDKIAGTMHVLMFWGFLMLATDMFDLASANFFSNHIIPQLLIGPWNGIVCFEYDGWNNFDWVDVSGSVHPGPGEGDEVTLTGTIEEYYNTPSLINIVESDGSLHLKYLLSLLNFSI